MIMKTILIYIVFLELEKRFIQTFLSWEGHSLVQHMFCLLQTQDLPHITFPLQEHIRFCRKSEVIIPSQNTGSGPAASWEYCSGQFLSNLNIDVLPILNRENVVSQPVNAWATGKIWQGVGDKVRLSSWTGILAWCPLHLWLFQWETTSAQWTRA